MDRSFARAVGQRVVSGLIWAGITILVFGFIVGGLVGYACGEEPRFWKLPPGKIADPFQDIRAHTNAWTPYPQDGRMTEAHENTHQINSEARNSAVVRQRVRDANCFYCLRGRLWVVDDPVNTTLRDVQLNFPEYQSNLDPCFAQYVVAAQRTPRGYSANWNDTPTYLLDEMVAYTNGAIVGAAIGDPGWEFEARQARRLTHYSLKLAEIVEAREARGQERKELGLALRLFIYWNMDRIPKPIYITPPKNKRPLPPESPMMPFPWHAYNDDHTKPQRPIFPRK